MEIVFLYFDDLKGGESVVIVEGVILFGCVDLINFIVLWFSFI